MFFCLAVLKDSFLAGCRPIIALDGCFLKSVYGGQLLSAIGSDNMVPIALAVVLIERRETWSWFLRELHDVIGNPTKKVWSYISDRQKGLCEVFTEEYPNVHHRFCVRHMYQNFIRKFPALNLKDLLWKATSTANIAEFKRLMMRIERADPKVGDKECAVEWLRKIPATQWARSHFPIESKCDVLVNNICESFNNYILDARDKPIITMFEMIRTRLMTRLQVKRMGMEKYNGVICPNIIKKVDKVSSMAKYWCVNWAGAEKYEVMQVERKYIVDLDHKYCNCGMFELQGYPCIHALACINIYGQKVEDFIDPCYSKEVYMKIYEFMIHHVPGINDYVETNYDKLKPPLVKKMTGRPKMARRKGVDETSKRSRGTGVDETSTRSSRISLTHTCQKCLQLGHNKRSCKNQFHPDSPIFKEAQQAAATEAQTEICMQHSDIEAQQAAATEAQTEICMQHYDIGTTRPKPRPRPRVRQAPNTETSSSGYTSFRNEALLGTRRLVASNLRRQTPAPAQSHPSTMHVDVTVVSSSLASSSHLVASNSGRLKRATESQVVENIRKRKRRNLDE